MILAVDTETTGTDFYHGCAPFMVLACDGSSNYYWQGKVNPYTREVYWDDDDLDEIRDLLRKADRIIFHNSTFDVKALSVIDIDVDWDKVEDTLLAAHVLHSAKADNKSGSVGRTLGLKDLAIEYLHYWNDDEIKLEEQVKAHRPSAANSGYAIAKRGHPHFPGLKGSVKWWAMDYWLCPEECLEYGLGDVERTWLLWDAFKVGLTADGLWEPYKLRKQLLPIVLGITDYGLHFHKAEAINYVERCQAEQEKLRQGIKDESGIKYKFDPKKRDHLIDLIHTRLRIPVAFRTEKDAPAVNKEALKHYTEVNNEKAIEYLRDWNVIETEKRYVESYIAWCDDDNRIHSNLNTTGTRETRQSSSNPNQQNIKGALKQLFGPPPGRIWLDIDFVNIELRIWAYSVGNEQLIKAFEEGISVHKVIMAELYPSQAKTFEADPSNEGLKKLYRNVKAGNFAIIYGATQAKADATYGMAGAYSRIVTKFPEIQQFSDSLIQQVHTNVDLYKAPAVHTLGGYRLDVPLEEPFKACNYYTQGSAGMLMGMAMIAVHNNKEYQDNDCHMCAQVHDSLVIDMPIHKKIRRTIDSITDSMETCAEDIFTICPVDYEVKYNEEDCDNPLIDPWTLPF